MRKIQIENQKESQALLDNKRTVKKDFIQAWFKNVLQVDKLGSLPMNDLYIWYKKDLQHNNNKILHQVKNVTAWLKFTGGIGEGNGYKLYKDNTFQSSIELANPKSFSTELKRYAKTVDMNFVLKYTDNGVREVRGFTFAKGKSNIKEWYKHQYKKVKKVKSKR